VSIHIDLSNGVVVGQTGGAVAGTVIDIGTAPCLAQAAFTSVLFTILRTSALSLFTTSAGVPLGAIKPSQMLASKRGTPDSWTVAKSGRLLERVKPVLANARTLPSRDKVAMVVSASNITSTCPPTMSVRAPELPL
jgi:hypothetical protein